jgi:hypothetical protein
VAGATDVAAEGLAAVGWGGRLRAAEEAEEAEEAEAMVVKAGGTAAEAVVSPAKVVAETAAVVVQEAVVRRRVLH